MESGGAFETGGGGDDNKIGIDDGFDALWLSFDLDDATLDDDLANSISGSGELSLTSGTFTGDSGLAMLLVITFKFSLFFSKTEVNLLEPPREGTGTVGILCESNA